MNNGAQQTPTGTVNELAARQCPQDSEGEEKKLQSPRVIHLPKKCRTVTLLMREMRICLPWNILPDMLSARATDR